MCLAIEVEVVCVVMWLNFMFVNCILKMLIFKIRIILRFKKNQLNENLPLHCIWGKA